MFMPSSTMLHSLKPFQCPSCNYSFTGRETTRVHNVPRFPLILSCGHTVCESCVKNAFRVHKKVVCCICQQPTDTSEGENSISKLLPDVYVLGVVCANLKQALPSLKMKLVPVGPTVADKHENSDIPFVICEHCSTSEASYRCEKCEEDFCNRCFDSYHNSGRKNLKKHVGTPVYAYRYNSMVQEGCLEHDRAIEFYCEEDGELICSHCVITGKHKGHAVLTLLEKNRSCADDLNKIREETAMISQRLKFTEQKLAQAVPNEKIDSSQWVKEIHDHFHSLHTALIIRENELLQQIEEISITSVSKLEKMRQEVSDSCKDLNAVLRDAELVVENPALSVSAPAILKKLESASSLPCHLIPIDCNEEGQKHVNIEFEPSLMECVQNHGSISADVKPKFYLESNDSLPEGYIIEPCLPEPVSIPTDTESLASDISEDSLSAVTSPTANISVPIPLRFEKSTCKQEKVLVCHIRNPSCFWVIRSSDSRKLKQMSDQINRWCRSSSSTKFIPKEVKLGDLYLVQYTVDNKWYRGRVKEIFDVKPAGEEATENAECSENLNTDAAPVLIKDPVQKNILIYYVDFGNSELSSINRMREIQPQFLHLPGTARQCCLYDISPSNGNAWSIEAIKVFGSFIHEKEVNMKVLEEKNNVLYVDLSQAAATDIMNDVPVSVRDALVFLEHGCFISEHKSSTGKQNKGLRHFLPPEHLHAGSRASVNISHIESPSLFYIQQLSTSRHLSDLILEMQTVYTEEENILHAVYVPYVGMICAAQFQTDKLWYRAEVLGIAGGAQVEVEFVDFGYREVLHHKYLRKILDRFTKLNKQAIPCCLADVTYKDGKGWQPEAKAWLSEYTAQKRFTMLSLGMVPNDKRTKAVLYDMLDDMEICVNSLMAQSGIAHSAGPYSVVTSKPRATPKPAAFVLPVVAQKPIKCPVAPVICDEQLEDEQPHGMPLVPTPSVPLPTEHSLKAKEEPEDHVRVHVSHIESPGIFYIRIATEFESKLKELMKEMQEMYRNYDDVPNDIYEGSSCAAYLESNKAWYRSIVLTGISEDKVKVRCVDYGYVDDVPIKHLRVLLSQFSRDKAFAVKCHLASILPAGGSDKWPQVAVAAFKDLVAPHDILYLICEGDVDGRSLPCDLLYKEIVRGGALEPSMLRYKSIVQDLIERGVALPIRSKRRIETSTTISSKPDTQDQVPTDNGRLEATSPALLSLDTQIHEPKERTKDLCHTLPVSLELQAETARLSPKQSNSTTSLPSPRMPTFSWKPSALPNSEQFAALVTEIDEEGCIFLQVKPEGTKSADLIKKALQCKYACMKSFETVRIPPPVGEACVAKFVLDDKWYRAEIVGAPSGSTDSIKVQFVDYGNCEVVKLHDIQLDAPMKDVPRSGLECELFDVVPIPGPYLSRNILDFLHETLVEQFCNVTIKSPPEPGKRLQVSITVEETNMNINDMLKDMGCAISVEELERRKNMPGPSGIGRQMRNGNTYMEASPLKMNEPFPVCITQIIEPTLVFLQRLKVDNPASVEDEVRNDEIDSFLRLVSELSENAPNFPPVTDPEIGLACCAQYTFDNEWYRCKITEIEDDQIAVLYVDYGNSEILTLERLRLPEKSFLEFPVQAHICKIKGLKPAGNEWLNEVTKVLVEKMCHSGLNIFARVISDTGIYEVELLSKTEGGEFELIYQDLIDSNLVTICET